MRERLVAFFRRKVHRQHAVHTGLRATLRKGLPAHRFDRITITHQHDGSAGIAAAEFGDHIEHVMQCDPVLERALGSALDRRAVRHRVGERHAQFDHVRA